MITRHLQGNRFCICLTCRREARLHAEWAAFFGGMMDQMIFFGEAVEKVGQAFASLGPFLCLGHEEGSFDG